MAILTDAQWEVLRRCSLFSTPETQTALEAHISDDGIAVHDFCEGETILSPSDGEHMLGVILSGIAQVTKPSRGSAVVMSMLMPSAAFGAATLFACGDAVTRVTAKKSVTALLFAEAAFTRLMQESFDVTLAYCSYLTERIRFLASRIECMAGGSVADKLISFFEKNAVDGTVRLPYGMNSLAKAVSVSRASLYRALAELESAGLIERDGREIRMI